MSTTEVKEQYAPLMSAPSAWQQACRIEQLAAELRCCVQPERPGQPSQPSQLIAVAESCTGGMIASSIVAIDGSSQWFDRGFVTYSNEAKMELLSVSAKTLETYGAVSEETAVEMVTGGLSHSRADIAAAVTGIAGPTGGTPLKPVGTVCIACKRRCDNWVWVGTFHFPGNRLEVRQAVTAEVLAALCDLVRLPHQTGADSTSGQMDRAFETDSFKRDVYHRHILNESAPGA